MEDKEVGELWRQIGAMPDGEIAYKLIRKLVFERAGNTQIGLPEYSKWTWQDCVNDALRDFGIDPETYK